MGEGSMSVVARNWLTGTHTQVIACEHNVQVTGWQAAGFSLCAAEEDDALCIKASSDSWVC